MYLGTVKLGYKRGGFDATDLGFLGGAVVYTAANWYLATRGAKHRKRSGGQQPSEAEATDVAAEAMLAMLAATMIPEAFDHAHTFAGLITVVGFLVAFVLTKVMEQ